MVGEKGGCIRMTNGVDLGLPLLFVLVFQKRKSLILAENYNVEHA